MYYLPEWEALRARFQNTIGHYYIISYLGLKVNDLAWANDNKINELRTQWPLDLAVLSVSIKRIPRPFNSCAQHTKASPVLSVFL